MEACGVRQSVADMAGEVRHSPLHATRREAMVAPEGEPWVEGVG